MSDTKTDYCLYCKQEFIKKNKKHKFCSNECKVKGSYLNMTPIIKTCDNCKKTFESKSRSKYTYSFCCKECEKEFKYRNTHTISFCEICNSEMEHLKSYKKRFCSIKCQSIWQKQRNKVGKSHHSFNSHLIHCFWCNKEYFEVPSKLNSNQKRFFCSQQCRREWHSKVFSQSQQWKQNSQKRAVRMLSEGKFSKTNSSCQIKINQLLNDMGIRYQNEKSFIYCAVDNYLPDFNLIIEVMGTYWHADNRFYNEIKYKSQINRIRMDKIKKVNIKEQENINILYLWEYDVENNLNICKKLIKTYIECNGELSNYNSFNYEMIDGNLQIKNHIIIPYMEWDKTQLSDIINEKTKKTISKKQPDKWITFNCEHCGKEREELISHYKKKQNHFCSTECARHRNKYKTNGHHPFE